MHSSANDPTNSFRAWSSARTYHATRPQDWTPEANLYRDYLDHAAAAGVPSAKQLSRTRFREELRALCCRTPQLRRVQAPGRAAEHADCWPRTLRTPARVAA